MLRDSWFYLACIFYTGYLIAKWYPKGPWLQKKTPLFHVIFKKKGNEIFYSMAVHAQINHGSHLRPFAFPLDYCQLVGWDTCPGDGHKTATWYTAGPAAPSRPTFGHCMASAKFYISRMCETRAISAKLVWFTFYIPLQLSESRIQPSRQRFFKC